MQMCRGLLTAVAAGLALGAGCRPAEPPEFTPGPGVLELTEGVDPQEEADVYKMLRGLQDQIADILAERVGTPEKIKMLGNPHVDEAQLKRGYELFTQYCVQCHGVNGDGNGPLADYLNPRPRDYTAGIFKFVATDNGSKARRSDIVGTLYRGVTGTSMPSFDEFSEKDREAVADYVLALTFRGLLQSELAQIAYDDEELPETEGIDEIVEELLEPWHAANEEVVMPLSPMPPMSPETVAKGKELFIQYSCHKCHGEDGRGSMFGGVEVGEDAWGYEASAADLTSGMFRGGGRPIDIYRRVLVGINGAPMPSRRADLAEAPDAIWYIVHYIKEIGEKRRNETVRNTLAGLKRLGDTAEEQLETDEDVEADEPASSDESAAANDDDSPDSETEASDDDESESADADSADAEPADAETEGDASDEADDAPAEETEDAAAEAA
ncbi:MAG: hypothetical protein CMJ58_11610 [Planctomycetaceae bacterium]|nr:hypothetical protein [Planctomycetaceae bacterium]